MFKKYQFIFNQDTKTIGLYNAIIGNATIPKPSSRKSSDSLKKPGSFKLIIFLLLIVIAMLSIYIFRNRLFDNRKKEMKKILNDNNKEIQLVSYDKKDNDS